MCGAMHKTKKIKLFKNVIAVFVLFLSFNSHRAVFSDETSGCVPYSLTPFQKATYRYVPADRERADTVALAACPGEFEPATFSLYALKDLARVGFAVSDLRCGEGVIPAAEVDIRIVKVWTQSGDDLWVDVPVEVPELLLYRDDVELKGRRPSAGGERTALTSVPQGTSKQFWVTVKVPEDAAAGEYAGTIAVDVAGGRAASLALKVTVLPFRLARPRRDFLIYFRANLDPTRGAEYEPWDEFERQVRNIREHGFTGASIYSREEFLPAILKKYVEAGFTSPVPYLGRTKGVAEVEEIVKKAGPLRVVYYGMDEPNSPDKAEACRKLFEGIQNAGGTTVTAIMKKYADMIWDSIDIVNYSLCDQKIDAYIRGLSEGRVRKNTKREWYYWQIMKERPKTARLMSGFFLWKSKLDGIFPFCYQTMNIEDPYDDFTPWEWAGLKWRPHLVTYPSKEGPIDTLQWEACREGIDDMKYIATLEDTIRRLRNLRAVLRLKSMGNDGEDPRVARIDRIIADSEKVLKEIDAKIDPDCLKALEKLTEKDLVDFRAEIVREIVKGVKALEEQ